MIFLSPQRNLTEYFVAVDVNNMLHLYASMLYERRILICCSKLSTVSKMHKNFFYSHYLIYFKLQSYVGNYLIISRSIFQPQLCSPSSALCEDFVELLLAPDVQKNFLDTAIFVAVWYTNVQRLVP